MLQLTPNERKILLCLAVILLTGSGLHYIFKRHPSLEQSISLIDSDRLYDKLDLNKASMDELIALPYIGPYTARNIVEYREAHGPFASVSELKAIKGIRDENYKKFEMLLKIN